MRSGYIFSSCCMPFKIFRELRFPKQYFHFLAVLIPVDLLCFSLVYSVPESPLSPFHALIILLQIICC